jgi:hypothetical protein
MHQQLLVKVPKQQISQVQAALEVGQDLGAAVELRVQVVRDVLAHKTLEKGVDACQIEVSGLSGNSALERRLGNGVVIACIWRRLLHV